VNSSRDLPTLPAFTYVTHLQYCCCRALLASSKAYARQCWFVVNASVLPLVQLTMPLRPPLHIYHWHAIDKFMVECEGGGLARSSGPATYRPQNLGQADSDSSSSDSRRLDRPNLNSVAQFDPQGQRSKSLQSSKPASQILPPVPEEASRSEPEARITFPLAHPPVRLPPQSSSPDLPAQELASTCTWMTTYPSRAMFNAKGLSELLAKHERKELFPRLL